MVESYGYALLNNEEYEKASQIKQKENEVKEKIAAAKLEWDAKHTKSDQIVGEEEIADIVSSWTGIPVKRLAEEETERLRNMEATLHERAKKKPLQPFQKRLEEVE